MPTPAEFDWEACKVRIEQDLERLCDEAERLDLVFKETKFFGSSHNFPNCHAGFLMACMSKLDFLSLCMEPAEKRQTHRMLKFLDTFVAPKKKRENRLILQMFRHSLMHSGMLRFMTNNGHDKVFTWRPYWSEATGGDRHYEISDVDPRYQDQLLSVHQWKFPEAPQPSTHCLHWRLTSFARELQSGAARFLQQVSNSTSMQEDLVTAYRRVAMEAARGL